jgi:uncharacterized protein YciI
MAVFAVTYSYTDDIPTRDSLRTEHRDYLRELADRGVLLLSGPFGPGEAPGALLLFLADDKSSIATLVAMDPFATSGVLADSHIAHWDPVIGPLLTAISD